MAEYLQRIVRLVILLFVLGAPPNRPTVDFVVGGLAQGLARGVKVKVTVTFYSFFVVFNLQDLHEVSIVM